MSFFVFLTSNGDGTDPTSATGFSGLPFPVNIREVTPEEKLFMTQVSREWLCAFWWRARCFNFKDVSGTVSVEYTDLFQPAQIATLTIDTDSSAVTGTVGTEIPLLQPNEDDPVVPWNWQVFKRQNDSVTVGEGFWWARMDNRRRNNSEVTSNWPDEYPSEPGVPAVVLTESGDLGAVSGTVDDEENLSVFAAGNAGSVGGTFYGPEVRVDYDTATGTFWFTMYALGLGLIMTAGGGSGYERQNTIATQPFIYSGEGWTDTDDGTFYAAGSIGATFDIGVMTVRVAGFADVEVKLVASILKGGSGELAVGDTDPANGAGSMSLDFTFEAAAYWPWNPAENFPGLSDGPVWDAITGAQLRNPIELAAELGLIG